MVKILGLVTCYNRKEKTLNAVHKLIDGNPQIHFSFIIVDDNSSDGTRSALEDIRDVNVVDGDGNAYYSGGMRLAIDHALRQEKDVDYCLLFNDDVDFYKDAIGYLLQGSKDTIWVGPTCNDQGVLSYGGIIKKSRWRPVLQIIKSENKEGRECDSFNANCVLIPWDIFKKLGNMDSAYTHSMGDFDYGFAANKKKIQIKVSDRFIGICNPDPSEGSWRDTSLSRKRRLQLKEHPKGLPGKEWFHFLNKNYSFLTAVIYSLIPYVRIILKL